MDVHARLAADARRRGTCFDGVIDLEDVEASDADEDEEEDEDERPAAAGNELPCPFCGEEFDALGMYCHIEAEHPVEASAGVCPVCADKVGINLVPHITSEHPTFLKDKWRNRRSSYGSHSSTLALLKKNLRERDRHPLNGGSSRAVSMSTVPDPLLSSFVSNFVEVDLPKAAPQVILDEADVGSDSLEQKAAESAKEPLLPEVKEERTRRSQFVQGLVLSLIFDEVL
ncbi:hypothetical protein EJB05_01186 [Eragrostis curvula]|uniref:Drought induced 19 protein type zinc-binding domain-containing protein n=1 Tax=Eragrostis curvula TaxID=38414 RepID=A0A5J9WNT1_9POAL|nr:hypothetical protein EJB05_01186 [Eragrostis curvula]